MRSVPWPRKVSASKLALRQDTRPLDQSVEVLEPGGNRVRLVEPACERDRVPEAVDVGLAVDLLGPALVGTADADPGAAALVDQPLRDPAHGRRGRERVRDPFRIETAERVGAGEPERVDTGGLAPAPLLDPRLLPVGCPADRLARRELDVVGHDLEVLVVELDLPRAELVRCARDRPHELGVLDQSPDHHVAARLQIRADSQREVRVALEQVAAGSTRHGRLGMIEKSRCRSWKPGCRRRRRPCSSWSRSTSTRSRSRWSSRTATGSGRRRWRSSRSRRGGPSTTARSASPETASRPRTTGSGAGPSYSRARRPARRPSTSRAWNAEACYALDPGDNIVELIAHHELPEESPEEGPFSGAELLGVCEVGLVVPDQREAARALEPLGIGLWDGTLDVPERLAFMGGRDGVLILTRPGRGWMPTGRPAEMHPVEAVVADPRGVEVTLPGTGHVVRTIVAPQV